MMFPLVRDLAAEGFPVRLTCGVLGFSPQAFYKWQKNPVSDRDWVDAHVTNAIVDVHADDPEFGYRFISDELEAAGQRVNERRVWRLCRDQRVWSITTRKGRKSSAKKPGPAVHDDLVQRVFRAPAPDVVWLTDITEHPTVEGKLYCCSIKDVFSNRIVGYAIDERMTARLAVTALRSAIARRLPDGTVIVHSDRGSQFRSRAFRAVLKAAGLHGSMGRVAAAGGQRRDGVLPRAVTEERPRPAPLAHTRRAALRDHPLDRTHLQPPPPTTRARQAHARRVRARIHPATLPRKRRTSSMISHNPPSTKVAADPSVLTRRCPTGFIAVLPWSECRVRAPTGDVNPPNPDISVSR